MIALGQFKRLKEIIDKYIYDDIWKNHFLLDSIYDEEYYNMLIKYFEFISKENLACEELHAIFLYCYQKSNFYFNLIKNDNDIENAILSEKYFGFIENVTNDSIIIRNVMKKLCEEFGENYLESVASIDQNLSYDNIEIINNYNVSNTVKLYLLIKYWQEKQHKYIESGFLNKIDEIFYKYNQNNGNFIFGTNYDAKFTYLMNKFLDQKFINIDYFTMLQIVEPTYDFSSLVGGKANGLIKLNRINCTIPTTYIYIGGHFNKEDIPKFDKYAVRSSATCEDATNCSFAGMFNSFLNVSIDNLAKKILEVQESIDLSRVQTYLKDKKIDKLQMRVIIQEYKEPIISGVWFGSDENPDYGVLEYIEGSGDKLVGGYVTPHRVVFNQKNHENNLISISKVEIYKQLIKYQSEIGECCDFEWCIVNNKLIMLQCRPITTPTKNFFAQFTDEENENVLKGIPASPGIYAGNAIFIDELAEKNKWIDNSILLTWFTDPDWLDIILKSKAVVVAIGGFLSHTSIICREYNIPCVCALGSENLYRIKDTKEIKVDGNKGLVYILKK